MKTAILAGGRGTRMGEAFGGIPKPLVPIGDRPVLQHVLDCHAGAGFDEFVIALGEKGGLIRAYFDGPEGTARNTGRRIELVETGPDTETGGRLLRLRPWLRDAPFLLAWADGLTDADLAALVAFHSGHGRLATVVAVSPPPRFGHLILDGSQVLSFDEKPPCANEWISAGLFVLEPGVFDLVEGDACSWEYAVLPRLAQRGELMAWRHTGFWQCMDTPSEQRKLEDQWRKGTSPWRRDRGA